MVTVNNIRIVVADDSEEMLSLVIEVLQRDFDVVAAARDGRDLLHAANNYKPDVIIADINMPELSGIEATKKIVEEDPEVKVILLTMLNDRAVVEEGISAGAKGYIFKLAAGRELVPAVYEVIRGGLYISPHVK